MSNNVFYNTAHTKLFQDGASYLAFENECTRYNNYIWLEAVSAVPNTEYFKTEYTVVDK
ncbi:MAG: hypothetical protein MJ010_04415 [Paludibacteraceae bacterium]|nr:hypothetical protein [Paludibacteraceae bacterium]